MSAKEKLIARAKELENERCASFPFFKICNEVPNMHFDDWCESCKARAVMQAFRETGQAKETK